MTINKIIEELPLKILSNGEGLEIEVTGGYTSDLLSDVMGHANQGNIWITLQTHKNVIAIASLKDLAAVILVKGFQPDEDMLEQANKEGIPVLSTNDESFDITGKLYKILNL